MQYRIKIQMRRLCSSYQLETWTTLKLFNFLTMIRINIIHLKTYVKQKTTDTYKNTRKYFSHICTGTSHTRGAWFTVIATQHCIHGLKLLPHSSRLSHIIQPPNLLHRKPFVILQLLIPIHRQTLKQIVHTS